MSKIPPRRRIGALATAAVSLATVSASVATAHAAQAANPAPTTDPVVSFFAHHPGAMPTRAQEAHLQGFKAAHPAAAVAAAAAVTGPNTLSFGGGTNGIGVMSGAKTKVYLVFYGSQWGSQSTDANGNAKFTGDASGTAGAAQQMFKGIGTNGETWSADLTQWCDGPGVSVGATSCPANLPGTQFVPYQAGGVLAGVWYDNASTSPAQASGHQLGQEAVNAAAHFGNTTAAANRDAYYVILSPHGTNPDDYKGLTTGQGYCAWHTWAGDSTLSGGGAVATGYGNLAFSNQPYNTDQGAACGVNFVNSGAAGALDGYTMTLGHEWHEMISDVDPNSAWSNPNSSPPGQENSDECAWKSPGTAGGAANVSFGSFGTFAEQASWSNDTNECDISHQILNHGGQGNTVTVTNPGSQSGTVGKGASVQIQASDSASGQTLTYSATGLPTGLTINSSTGLISGTPTAAGSSSVTVTAKDTTGASGSATFSWTESSTSGGCTAANLIGDGGFENGTAPWTGTTGSILQPSLYGGTPHTGTHAAWLDGYGTPATDTIAQSVSIPAGCTTATFSFWRYVDTSEYALGAADTLKVQVLNSAGTVLGTLHTYSNLDANNAWTQSSFSLAQYAGQTVTVKFTGTETDAYYGTTDFILDDVALNVH